MTRPKKRPRLDTAEDVAKAMCALSCSVMREAFASQHAADCFCEASALQTARTADYRFSREVFDFMRDAVKEKIAREKKAPKLRKRRGKR
jgi:hypothetical protein